MLYSEQVKQLTRAQRQRLSSVLVCLYHLWIAAFNVLRIHSETVWLLALASVPTAFNASGVKRAGTILPFAAPLGSFGRPSFLPTP
jgi:hypothetical protein